MPRPMCRTKSATVPLDAKDLLERVHYFDPIALCLHHGVDVLVGHRDLVDHVGILAAFNAVGRLDLVFQIEKAIAGLTGSTPPLN